MKEKTRSLYFSANSSLSSKVINSCENTSSLVLDPLLKIIVDLLNYLFILNIKVKHFIIYNLFIQLNLNQNQLFLTFDSSLGDIFSMIFLRI